MCWPARSARGVYEATALPFRAERAVNSRRLSERNKVQHSVRETARAAIGRRIAERRLARHHLGQQPPAHRAERQPPMRVADRATARLARRAADHRRESGKHGRRPSHGSLSTGSPSGNSSRAFGISRSNCTGVGGASRAANSAPVVSRIPCSIGATT